MNDDRYDLVVLGAGTAGLTVARLVAQEKYRVALVEEDRPGGDCLWHGCVPTKALIHAAHLVHQAHGATAFGLRANGNVELGAIRAHIKRAQTLAGAVDSPAAIASWGVELVKGRGRFTGPHTVAVEGRRLTARHLVIATGTRPVFPDIPGLKEAGAATSTDALAWESVPASLAVIGGGTIGVELGQAFSRLGSRVSIIEQSSNLLPAEDPAASTMVEKALRSEGIDIQCSAQVLRTNRRANLVEIEAIGRPAVCAERLLVATGRRPSIAGLNLEAAGVRTNRRGVAVDRFLRTSAEHIFAVGDVSGGPQFTHVAEDQARTVAKSIVARGWRRKLHPWNNRVVPRVTFCDPEVASVGRSESRARASHEGVRSLVIPLEQVDRALTQGQADGFLKIVTGSGWTAKVPGLRNRLGDEILGATLVGANAGDLLFPIVMAMRARLPVGLLAWNMQAYPTMALGLRQAAGQWFER